MPSTTPYLKIYPEKCTGCNLCVYSCALKHTGDFNPRGSRIRIFPKDTEKKNYIPFNCVQCKDPVCIEVCPTKSIQRNGDGMVVQDSDRCIGCLLCTMACPYGGMYFDEEANKSMLCDYCDGVPECVRVCPENALEYDGVENINSLLKESEDLFSKGLALCLGCSSEMAVRFTLRVLGRNTILHIPPSCSALTAAGYMTTPSVEIPASVGFLTNSASFLTGVSRHYKREGKKINVITFSGDGGTADVGFQSLSGAAERNEGMIYICNDNEGYMNTGMQRSGTTPFGAWTSTTPVGDIGKGKVQPKKEMPLIMLAHQAPYVATATVGFLSDYEAKLRKAMDTEGFAYIHMLNPCPTGWRFPPDRAQEVSRRAVQTNFFPLWEAEEGKVRVTVKIRARKPVEEYTKLQGKYEHLDKSQLEQLQQYVDEKYIQLRSLESLS
ncbi:MAG TPA: thiamine pyrophosphate-dependent enzyme [Syntrophales bacterium]|nr:thiamine pyrophosphate-dependent enzyme [Syntrophales bacterium]